MVLWKYRSFCLYNNTFGVFNEVESFLNELSAEGYNDVVIENFSDRTTVYAKKYEDKNKEENEHKEEDMVRYSGIIRKHG